ncbi:hypothetical protein M758_10G014600 [Ceratodon purpureus]|uniref:RING-type E3 ubiquitin transferase n=1 Tax=Ceratodon purpureus TaxID=3225 RepID=A0A8T0GJD2_CERPU|nr:hypothetical protein KC19_10G015500 [Ceratodon purpureus]KAG0602440.1 hypothetical protein M758_10G014600 [Ceratodon purpureus]
MGNLPSSRRSSRISQNPGVPPPPRMIPAPAGYPGGHVPPPPGPANYPPHLPYYPYPPYSNGAIPPPQYFQNVIQTNGQYMMNLPPPQIYRNPGGMAPHPVPPPPRNVEVAEHQKANTIQNDVNLKKATLRLEKDEENPGYYLVAFSFDATVAGSICVFFLAKEGSNCSLTPVKPHIYTPVRAEFQKGLGQKFKQAPGTGVMLALFDDKELLKGGEDNVFPLVIRMETLPKSPPADQPPRDTENLGAQLPEWVHSQITQAIIERKDDDTYQVRVVKQIIWVGGVRYELQEIYGIENSGGGGNFDGTDAGKECVVCMSEPRDTTVLPCRHMCMCSECAKVLRFQTNRCPICRTPVERLLEIKVPKDRSELNTIKSDSNVQQGGAVESSSSQSTSALPPKICAVDESDKVESSNPKSSLGQASGETV